MTPQAWPSSAPNSRPSTSVGVNRPPGAPLPRQAAVTSGLRTRSTASSPTESLPTNASCASSLPLPSSCGYWIARAPSAPKMTIGASTRSVRRVGRDRLATATSRTQSTAVRPASGPISAAQTICRADTPYIGTA